MAKVPDPKRWESSQGLQDQFQKALIQQLEWINANLFELRNDVSTVSEWIIAQEERQARDRARREREGGSE